MGDQVAGQGDQAQIQGLNEAQGGLAAAQGGQDQIQGLNEAQGGLAAAQGGQDQIQGLNEAQGGLAAAQGGQDQIQGLNEAQGGLAAAQGGQDQIQGLNEAQGGLAAAQGGQDQIQGLNEAQGGLIAAQGPQRQKQGNLCESLGDMFQCQDGESQGDQKQGDQVQLLKGHGGQCQGDQMLISTPSISTPVNVSGINVNVNVDCNKCGKQRDCDEVCRQIIESLLLLIKGFANSITDPDASLIGFYINTQQEQPLSGNLEDVSKCCFTMIPAAGGESIAVLTTALYALEISESDITPDLFSLLLNYLQSLPNTIYSQCGDNHYDSCCVEEVIQQLEHWKTLGSLLEINTEKQPFTGYIEKIYDGIIYLVESLTEITIIYAIPVCKVISCQVQENEI